MEVKQLEKQEKLEIKYLKESEIKEYKNNTRIHSKEQIKQIKNSIKEFGMCAPIGIHKGTIVYGHARFEALKQLEWEEFPTIDLSHLTNAQMRAYVIADNKLSALSKWDNSLLTLELRNLADEEFDITLTGFGFDFLDVKDEIEAEKEFASELLESHNYIVLYFDNDLDWQVAKEKFGIKTVKTDGKLKREGVGRVLKGADFL